MSTHLFLSYLYYAIWFWLSQIVYGNVAYPGIWTGRQPNGEATGTEQILVGNPEYSYSVVETDDTFYPTVRDSDGVIRYATIDKKTGRYVASSYVVGIDNPEDTDLPDAQLESEHVVHAKCMELPFCKWKKQNNGKTERIISNGVVQNLVVPFAFKDHENREHMEIDELDQILFNGDVLSVKDYFLQQSYGKLEVVSEFAPWVTIDMTEAECADGKSGLTLKIHECLANAIEKLENLLDLTQVENDDVIGITFVHTGYAAEFGGNDPAGAWYEDRIWSHTWEIDTEDYKGRYALISDRYGRTNRHINRVGAAVHEIAQILGAPTLYGDYPGYGLGYYDMLSSPWGFDGTLVNCASMSPYTKALFGWIELEEINTEGVLVLEQSVSTAKVYKITKGFPDGEYLIIENRQEEGYDKGLSQPGIAIYHIDENANNIAGYPAQFNYPEDHYVVALVQADGRFDLERMEDEGDSGDLFHAGRFSGVGPDGVFLADGSLSPFQGGYPNTNAYGGGVLTETGITIKDISVSDKSMSFQISFVTNAG